MQQAAVDRRTVIAVAVGSLAGAGLLSACNSATAGSAETPVDLYITIVTGGMIHKKGWPAFVPSDLSVPANSTVNVRIVNFDDGTAPLPAGSEGYAKVTGVTGGQVISTPLVAGNPNASGTTKTYQELAPKDVSHTFTITKLNLNVPIPVSATVSFSFKAPQPGTYDWQCMAPCGTGPNNMGGAMATKGYMAGTLKVV